MARKRVKRKKTLQKSPNLNTAGQKTSNTFLGLLFEPEASSHQAVIEFEGMKLSTDDDLQKLYQYLWLRAQDKVANSPDTQNLNNEQKAQVMAALVKQAEHITERVAIELESKKFEQLTNSIKVPTEYLKSHSRYPTILDNPEIYYDLELMKLAKESGEQEFHEFCKKKDSYNHESIEFMLTLGCALGDFNMASRLLGRLEVSNINESAKTYARALYYFYTKKYSYAIKQIAEISAKHALYLRAQGLLAECYARTGHVKSLCQHIQTVGGENFTRSTLIKLKIILCQHSEDPEGAHNSFITALSFTNTTLTPGEDDPDRFFIERLILNEVIKFSQSLTSFHEYAYMASQEGESILDITHELIGDKQKNVNWGIKATSFEYLLNSSSSPKYAAINHLVSDFNNRREDPLLSVENMRTLFLLFQTLYNYGEFKTLITNFEAQYEHLSESMKKRLSRFVLKDEISDSNLLQHELFRRLNALEMQQNVLNKISVNARNSIKLSTEILNQLLESERSVDAGIVSLGFFRAIETELNEKFFKVLIEAINKKYVLQLFEDTNTSESWRKTWLWGWAHSSEQTCHIMLGPAFHFLKNTLRQKDELGLKLTSLIEQCLTDNGIEHFRSGKLQKSINPEIVKQFRNPPAHSKFLSVSSVVDCRDYVNETLSNYVKWFNAYNN